MSATTESLELISPEQYDAFERRGVAELPIASEPSTFERYGYPTHISWMREVLRYAYHNCEDKVSRLYRPGDTSLPGGYFNALTVDESQMLDTLRNQVAVATFRDPGRRQTGDKPSGSSGAVPGNVASFA